MSYELTPVEVRVLGALVEKALATPQNYPLTLNALRTACNQTTGRHPVVDYSDAEVEAALGSLRAGGWTRIVYSPSNRAPKYRHVLDELLLVDQAQLAVLGVLLLRGPQTVGELRTRTERMHAFGSLVEVDAALDALSKPYASREEPLVVRLPARPGQKEARWAHLLCGEPVDLPDAPAAPTGVRSSERVAELEAEVQALRSDLEILRSEFEALRAELM